MGYPTGYRSATARQLAGGSIQNRPLPRPWQRPVGPANDNVPRPANDNLPGLPRAGRLKPTKAMLRALTRLGYNPEDLLLNGVLSAMNSLPGFATPQALANAAKVGIAQNFMGLPLYKFWAAGVTATIAGPEGSKNTRQTGQALQVKTSQNLGNGQYLSTFEVFLQTTTQQLRYNELATYGPSVGATKNWSFPYPFPQVIPVIPYVLVPYKRVDPFIYEAGNVDPAVPVVRQPKPLTFTPRRPPGPRVKERKTRAQRALLGLLKLLGDATELDDFMDAFHDALPKNLQAKFRKGEPKWKQEVRKAQALYANYMHVDLDSALFNALWNNLEDRVYGSLGIKSPGRYGGNVGANELVGQAFGNAVRDLLRPAKQFTQDRLNTVPGFTLK